LPAAFKGRDRRLAAKDTTALTVKSPFGISQAVIERQEDAWPKAVVLRSAG